MFDLGGAPVYFEGDEAHFASIARELSRHGTNLVGDAWPVMVNIGDPLGGPPSPWGNTYYQPLMFYVIAAALKVLPFTEAAVRVPAALFGGLFAPVLLYLALRRSLGEAGALGAALVLGLAPLNVLVSRRALDYIAPVPFVAAWLWGLSAWHRDRRPWQAAAIGVILGAGCYSYIASWMLMPGYLVLSTIVFAWSGPARVRTIATAWFGFALVLIPLVTWIAWHPQMLTETFARYEMADQQTRLVIGNPASWLPAARAYASYFDPLLWFVFGGPSLTTSTGRVGVFLLPVAVLMVVGVVAAYWRRHDGPLPAIALAGLLSAPLPAAMAGDASMMQRATPLLVFAAVFCGFAADALWHSRRQIMRYGLVALCAVGLLQFGVFYRDYFTHYKYRAAFYLDPVAFKDVASFLLAAPPGATYYFHTELDDAPTKWRFYATQADRQEVLARTRYVSTDRFPIEDAPAGSWFVTYVQSAWLETLTAGNEWTLVRKISDVDNREAAAILRKGAE